MSQPAPTPRQNFIQTALLMLSIFLAFNLWTQSQNAPAKPSGDLHQAMLNQNRDRLDVSIVQTSHQYQKSIDQQLQNKKITPEEADRLKVEATVLVADTQFKAGIHGNHTDRIRDAYNTLVGMNRTKRDTPVWNTPVAVVDVSQDPKFGWKEWSGQHLYDRVVQELSKRNQTDLVWGFIPGYQLMDFLVHLTGAIPSFSYALAGLFLAILVRACVFKLATKQIMSGRQMSQLMPLVKEIKDQYANDQVEQNNRVMALYKEYGVNPFSGCGPAFIQIPLFYTIYQCMLHYQFEFQKGTFLWINPETSKATHGFIAPNLGQQDTILVIIYGITMMVTTLLTPVSDPTQARQQRLMSVAITIIFTAFMFTGAVPVVSGFVLYWIFTNMLATTQSLILYRRPMAPLQKVNTAAGGVYPTSKWGKFMESVQSAQEENLRKNGGSNGKGNTFLGSGETKTGTPGKHKPKKRK